MENPDKEDTVMTEGEHRRGSRAREERTPSRSVNTLVTQMVTGGMGDDGTRLTELTIDEALILDRHRGKRSQLTRQGDPQGSEDRRIVAEEHPADGEPTKPRKIGRVVGDTTAPPEETTTKGNRSLFISTRRDIPPEDQRALPSIVPASGEGERVESGPLQEPSVSRAVARAVTGEEDL